MSGPTFTLLFDSIEALDLEQCLAGLRGVQVERRGQGVHAILGEDVIPFRLRRRDAPPEGRDCEYHLGVKPSELSTASRADQAAIFAATGQKLLKAVSVAASTKSHLEVDGLWFLEEKIVAGAGGWFMFRAWPDELAKVSPHVIKVAMADFAGYFRADKVDPAHVAEYEAFVPRRTLYFVDARRSGLRTVDY